eukprot:gene13289-24096_t
MFGGGDPKTDDLKHQVAIRKGTEAKEAGNALFKAGDLAGATRKYQEGYLETLSMLSRKDMNMGKAMGGGGGPDAGTAADMLGSMPKPKESARILELRKVHHDLMNNLAAIMFKKKRWDRDKDNLKARQRRAKAAFEAKQLAKCEEDVAFVLKVDPTHKQTLIVKASVDKVNKAYKDKQAAAFKGMFSS